MERQCTWAAIAIAALLVLGFDASASISAEEAVSMINYQTGISPFCYISGDTVRQIYEGNDLNMDFPDYTLTSRYPVYSYDPRDSSSLESVYSVSRDGFKPVLYEVLGGTFTKSRVDSGTYQFHWIVANQLANEIDLIRIDPFWTDDPVVVARYSLSTITIYNTVSGQGPSGQGQYGQGSSGQGQYGQGQYGQGQYGQGPSGQVPYGQGPEQESPQYYEGNSYLNQP